MGIKKLSRNIEKMLMEDEHIKAIHCFDHKTFPEINYSLWKYEGKARDNITGLRGYVDASCVEDIFGSDHMARRKWRDGTMGRNQIFQQVLDSDGMGAGK